MDKVFLYIDILGFKELVRSHSSKIDKIFEIVDRLSVHKHFALQTVIFSDTILIFNKNINYENHYYVTYLIEYTQQLFYKLSLINVYFKGVITLGEFNFSRLFNIDAYYGLALIETYIDEAQLDGFGLFINKKLTDDVVVFDKLHFNEKYDYILLCQSYINLYKNTNGNLPIDTNMFIETDTYFRIDEDLRFLREIASFKNYFPNERAKAKYQRVYDIYKGVTPKFFEKFEEKGFVPFTLNPDYIGSMNPFEIEAEKDIP